MKRFALIFCSLISFSAFAFQGEGKGWENPKVFIENHGQFPATGSKDANVLYAFDNGKEMIYFRRDGFSYTFMSKTPKADRANEREDLVNDEREWMKHEAEEHSAIFKRDDVFMTWENSNSDVQVVAEEMCNEYFTYAVKDANGEHTVNDNHGFRKLTYKNLYDHIDVQFIFHENGGIKYTIIVHPGGNAAQVRMRYNGAKKITIDEAGQIHLVTRMAEITDHAPVTFYDDERSAAIASAFVKTGNVITFNIGEYDHSRILIIDPWQLTSGLGFSNANRVWECEHDASANSYFWGGDMPMRLKKFNSAGALQWTYSSTWDTTSFWVGTFITDNPGNSYITGGSNGEIRKLNTSGVSQWYNNPNGLFGPLFEYWHLSFNCDQTNLLIGGMRAPNPFSIANYRGVTITINMGSGAVVSFLAVGWVAGINIKEVRSLCSAPNGNFYFLTLDSIGCVNSSNVLQWKTTSTYNFAYGNPSYAQGGNMGMSAIRANNSAIYTQNGNTVHKRNISTGAIVATAAIPGGITSSFLGNTFGNSGLDLDSCGNVYVGSGNQIVKYDANLNQLSTQSTPGAVYDVSVNKNGEVVACGNQWMGTYNMGNCNPMQAICVTSTLAATATSTNVTCFGGCNGTATASPSGGTSPYTYSWAPSGGTSATASGLCAGSYTCTVTDATLATTTVSVTITQPASFTATNTATTVNCSIGWANVTATPVGGTGPYTYSWSPSGGTGSTAQEYVAGNYTCTITDANGCTATTVAVVVGGTGPTGSLQSSTNNTCFGGTSGSATVTASGGNPGYTYLWSPSGGTAATATGLGAGTYTCTITESTGCQVTITVTITAPLAVTGTTSNTPATCGSNNGTAAVVASGGTGPYTYNWLPSGGTAASASNLAAGTYTCTITDANGCTGTAITTVTSAGGPTTSVQSVTNATCFGSTTGSATVSATGNGPFTYSWAASGGSSATANNLSAGTYTVTIADVNGCVSAQTLTITEPTAVTATASSTPTGCASSTGSATVVASGGTGTLTYNWLPSGGTAASASNLAAGSYTCTVTDANGCTTTAITTVTSTGGPTTSVQSTTDLLCNGGGTGAATVSATGNGPFTYAWSPSGGTSASASALNAGTYTVTITDVNGCVSAQTLTITEPSALVSTPTSTNATCGSSNGTADAGASGGTGPYTYLWSNAQTTATLGSLAGGSYSVTITDANGCTTTSTVNVLNTGAPTITVNSTTDPACFGASTGSATITASAGSPPYTYAWSPSGGSGATASNLAAGTYTVTVTGSDGCTQTQTITLNSPTAIVITSASTTESCGATDGSASVSASGGTSPYTYLWSTSATNDTITNIAAGSYAVTITDANGCTQNSTVVVGSTGTATANAGNTVTITSGSSTTLSGSGSGTTFTWSPPTGLSCTNCQTPTASPTVTTTYTLTVTDSLGCSATDTVTVIVDIDCGDIWVPTAFSPNGDNQNDVLYVRGNCIEFLQFNVYNRWGELVFSTTKPEIGWDGTWRNKECETAVFTYTLRATSFSGTEFEAQGNISLVK